MLTVATSRRSPSATSTRDCTVNPTERQMWQSLRMNSTFSR